MAAGGFRSPPMRLTGRLGAEVWAQRNESRHAAVLPVAGRAAFRRGRCVDAGVKPFWLQAILKGVGMVSTLWLEFCAKGHDQENKESNSRA